MTSITNTYLPSSLSLLGSSALTGGVDTSVTPTTDSSLSDTAVALAGEASVVSTLGAVASPVLTYNAVGLFDSIAQAGSTTGPALQTEGLTSQQSVSQLVDQSILSTLSSTPESSGVYTATGVLQTSSGTDIATTWANVLKTNPELAATAVSDSTDQAIIGATLSTFA